MIANGLRKGLLILGLSGVIWSLSLVWPEINLALVWPAVNWLIFGFGVIVLLGLWFWRPVSELAPVHSEAYRKARRVRTPSRPMGLTPR